MLYSLIVGSTERPETKESEMTVIYTYEGSEFQAEITRIENGTIYAKTLQSNGDYTLEHELPLNEIVSTVLSFA